MQFKILNFKQYFEFWKFLNKNAIIYISITKYIGIAFFMFNQIEKDIVNCELNSDQSENNENILIIFIMKTIQRYFFAYLCFPSWWKKGSSHVDWKKGWGNRLTI